MNTGVNVIQFDNHRFAIVRGGDGGRADVRLYVKNA